MRAAAEVGTGVVVDNCATVRLNCCYYMGLNADPDYMFVPEVPGCGGVETGIFRSRARRDFAKSIWGRVQSF